MPSDHSSSSHSSSSSSSSSGSSHSGSSGGYSGGSSGGYSSGGHSSYHDNDSFDNHHYSDYWSPVSGLFWFVGIAVIFIGIILNVNIDDELNKNNNSDSVIIYQTVSGTAQRVKQARLKLRENGE